MGVLEAEGIVLRKYYLRETSYILVLYTREFGKVRGVLKGVRKPFPQFAANFEMLSLCRVLFYKKKKSVLDLITHCEAKDYHRALRSSLEKLVYASYFVELVDSVTQDHDPNPLIFDILRGSLDMLGRAGGAKRVRRVFEIKFLGALGFSPQVDRCVKCSSDVEGKSFFSAASGGIMCGGCRDDKNGGMPVSLGTAKFISKIQRSEMDRAEHIKLSREVGLEIEKMLDSFIRYHIGRPVRSLKLLGDLSRSGMA